MEIERRSFEFDELRVHKKDGETTRITGHAAVFNQLSDNLGGFKEQIAPGAFKNSMDDDVRALFNHDSNYILGRTKAGTLRIKEDKTGLAVEIDTPDTQVARDLIVSMERGDITQMSFGFSVRPNGANWAEDDDGLPIRTLTDVRLFDVSPVAFPAYPQTDIAVRSLNDYKESLKTDDETKLNAIKDQQSQRDRELVLAEIS